MRTFRIIHLLAWILLLGFVVVLAQETPNPARKKLRRHRTESGTLDQDSMTVLTIRRIGNNITLRWFPLPQATGWTILRSESPNGNSLHYVASTTSTIWTDTTNLNFAFYQVLPIFSPEPPSHPDTMIVIEDFEEDSIALLGYAGQDLDSLAWAVIDTDSYDSSGHSLRLNGNTWKRRIIQPRALQFNTVWQVAMKRGTRGELQAFGVADSANEMWYLIWGSDAPISMAWIMTYQGWYAANTWIPLQLPIGEDWQGRFGYLPNIRELRFVNDNDGTGNDGELRIDEILDVTNSLPLPPVADFGWWRMDGAPTDSIRINFYSLSRDGDSPIINHLWDFGDGQTSTDVHPVHYFRAHGMSTVTLTVTDESNTVAWRSKTVSDSLVTQTRELTMAFTGDIMLGRGYENNGGIIETSGVNAIFDSIRQLILPVDIASGNLECAMTTATEHHPTKSIYFKGAPANTNGLKYCGFDFVTLANNHILDYLAPGMYETMYTLDTLGLPHGGCGANDLLARRTQFLSHDGLSLAMLSYSDRTGSYNNAQPYLDAARSRPGFAMWNRSAIEATIPQADSLSDFVILNVHSGSEYQYEPQSKQRSLEVDREENPNYVTFDLLPDTMERVVRHYAIDNGADLLIAHHPHIIQGFEVYNGKLIAHSLGNFAFDIDFAECLPSLVLQTHISATGGVDQATVIPVYVDHWIPRQATGGFGRAMLDYETEMSRALDTWLMRKPNEDTARIIWSRDTTLLTTVEWTDTLTLMHVDTVWISPAIKLQGDGYPRSVELIAPAGAQVRLGRDQLWFGNMENEGATPWDLNSNDEGYNTEQFHSGVRSIRLRRSVTGNVITTLSLRKPLDLSHSYSLCGWIMTDNAGNTTIEAQYWRDRTGGITLGQPAINTAITGTNAWTYVSGDLTPPALTQFFNLRLSLYRPTTGTGLAWFDDVSLVQWDAWQTVPIVVPFPGDATFIQVSSATEATQAIVHYHRSWLP